MEEVDSKVKYTTIHIPQALALMIDDLIRNGEFAYSSRSEFVKDALRRFLKEHGFYPRHSMARTERLALSLDANMGNSEEAQPRENLTEIIKHMREFAKYLEEISVNNQPSATYAENGPRTTMSRTQKQ